MMSFFLSIYFVIIVNPLLAQSKDSIIKPGVSKTELAKPEIFNGGFIDIVNNGQVNAGAKMIRLFVGEPGKFCLPLSLYTGVSSNNFQSAPTMGLRSNDALVTHFINPLSGLINISIEGIIYFRKKQSRSTRAGLLYHFGERMLTGTRVGAISDPATGRPHNFLNSFASLGYYLQTGAWEKGNAANMGICWMALRYIGCFSERDQLEEFLPGINTNGLYHGYSVAWGIEISHLVNLKLLYYKYRKKPEISYAMPIYQFSVNYTGKR